MTGSLNIDFEWLAPEAADALERATTAQITIAVDGMVATELEDLLAKTVRSHARLSAYELALWFAANWWRLRWEPERNSDDWHMSHHLAAIGGGYVWPNLWFASDCAAIMAHARQTRGSPIVPVRYLNEFDAPIDADAFERAIDDFVEAVLARLEAEGLPDRELAALWRELQHERNDEESRRWRKLEALLGHDPDEADETLVEALIEGASRHGPGAIDEVAAASMSRALEDLRALEGVGRERGQAVVVPPVGELPPAPRGQPPWARAEEAAKRAREAWGVRTGAITTEELARILGTSEAFIREADGDGVVPMPAAFREQANGAPDQLRVVMKTRHPTSRRFALARLVGDHIAVTSPRERLLPATAAKTARQKFQRAFAAEFLCPFDALRERFGNRPPDDEAIEEAAADFEVSPLVVKTMLVNKRQLPREVLAS